MSLKRDTLQTIIDGVIGLACLAVAVFVATKPNLIYAQTPKMVLFFVLSILAAILLASRLKPVGVTASFELKLRPFYLTAGGATAVFFGVLVLLAHFTKPTEHVMVLDFERNGSKISLDAVELEITASGRAPVTCAQGSKAFVLFHDDTQELLVTVDDGEGRRKWPIRPSPHQTIELEAPTRGGP